MLYVICGPFNRSLPMTFQILNQRIFARALLALLTVFGVMACSNQNIKFNNVDITGSKAFGKDFSLTDHNFLPAVRTQILRVILQFLASRGSF